MIKIPITKRIRNVIKLVILGQTPSKKNTHRSMYSSYKKRFIIAPSKACLEWENLAVIQLMHQMNEMELTTITEPVHCKILVYRATKIKADRLNLYQSVEDALEKAGVIENDFQIVSHDGSRVYYGIFLEHARAEIYLEVI